MTVGFTREVSLRSHPVHQSADHALGVRRYQLRVLLDRHMEYPIEGYWASHVYTDMAS